MVDGADACLWDFIIFLNSGGIGSVHKHRHTCQQPTNGGKYHENILNSQPMKGNTSEGKLCSSTTLVRLGQNAADSEYQ
jgi:hypothetical protein